MPKDDKHIRLEYCDTDYAVIKLAAALSAAPNLKAFCSKTLLDAAHKIRNDFRTQAQQQGPGDVCNPTF